MPVSDHDQRIVRSSEDPNWRTPRPLFDGLNRASGGFSLDLAADSSVLVDDYLGPGSRIADDALDVSWADLNPGGRGFLNPPYSVKQYRLTADRAYLIDNWAAKCWLEGRAGFETWGLFPFSPQTEWYRTYVMGHGTQGDWCGYAAAEVWRLPYRVTFDPSPEYLAKVQREFAEGTRKNDQVGSAGHNVVVVIWRPDPGWVGPWVPTERYWSYR